MKKTDGAATTLNDHALWVGVFRRRRRPPWRLPWRQTISLQGKCIVETTELPAQSSRQPPAFPPVQILFFHHMLLLFFLRARHLQELQENFSHVGVELGGGLEEEDAVHGFGDGLLGR